MARLPRRARLHSQHLFQRVLKNGRKQRGSALELRWLTGDVAPQLGVIINRHVGTAVERNRLKRIVREWFRHMRERLPHGAWIIRLLPPAATRSTTLLHRDLTLQLRRLI
ncbi:MAG: ribonuclease P protein component [Deltaproteobacteria bacterium]|nr:ribonuclease P protein component [Deltaproteobacteria bacterium]